jgi:iron(III) transport system substrate-binding protein
MSTKTSRTPVFIALTLFSMAGFAGCREESTPARVVVYTSVDEPFARSVLEAFRQRTGIQPDVLFDSEAGKTTGLVRRIQGEAGRPRCDVFFSSELFHTILLAREGLLVPYAPPTAADIPPRYRDPEHRWTGIGLRARVLAYDPNRADAPAPPKTWRELARPEHAGQLALANPLFGTTRGHVAAMFALWGDADARAFLTGLREGGAMIVDGNSAAVRAVMSGRAGFAATDTDDVWVAQRAGGSVTLAYPDMGDGGTLLIPCSVAMVKGGPNPEAARRLVDFLVSAEVERRLAESDSRNIPVRADLRAELGIERPPETRITYDAIADAMEESLDAVREILIR